MNKWITLGVLLALAATAPAQFTLTTTLVGGNGQSGNMFDITNISPATVIITGVDQNFFSAGTAAQYEVRTVTAGTTWVGNQANSAAWTLQGIATNIVHPGSGTAVPIPIALNIAIPPGATLGLYLTTTADTVAYTNGTTQGAVFVSDANIQIREGVGVAYPFAGTFSPRVWNGIVHYSVGSFNPIYQVNGAGSSLNFNGVLGTAGSKAVTSVCTGASVTANSGGATGLPWEAGYNFAPTVPATNPGALTTPGGQILNINLAAGISFLNGGAVPAFLPYFGPFSAPFNAGPVPMTISFQQLNFDPANPEGFSLSQSCQLNVAGGASVPGPAGDDVATTVNLSSLCAPGPVMMYGTAYTQIHVITNGRVTFGTADTSWTPSVAAAQAGPAFAGVWCDLYVTPPGNSILVDMMSPFIVRVRYIAVPYLSYAVPSTFDLQFDTSNGTVVFNLAGGIGVSAASQMVGMSRGAGATDPGAVAYVPPTTGTTTNSTAMIYALGTGGALTTGLTSISFFPNGYGNYDWVSQ